MTASTIGPVSAAIATAGAEVFRGYRRGMSGDADIARISALIGDPSRARVLMALTDGRALPAGVLAGEAGVSASTISEHLHRLLDAHLVAVERQGRTRRYRLAGPPVAEALEAIARIAPPEPVRSLRQDTHAHALRRARTCYNHLAGRLGVALMAALLRDGVLVGAHRPGPAEDRLAAPGRDVEYRLTERGAGTLDGLGVDLDALRGRRAPVRYCLDWSEQRHHLAGPLGTALTDRLFALGWLRRTARRRVVLLSDAGRAGPGRLGVPEDWDAAPATVP
jgi:DNA-binding transcriptional ArsR family regulator